MLDILGRQVAAPVQFVRGLETLYDAGARMFVEVGPKRALHGFAEDVLGATHDDAQALFTNHPKAGDVPSFNQALAGLYAAGLGAAAPRRRSRPRRRPAPATPAPAPTPTAAPAGRLDPRPFWSRHDHRPLRRARPPVRRLPRARSRDHGGRPPPRRAAGRGTGPMEPVVITGAALGLPGTERVFDDHNVARLLSGEQLIDLIPTRFRHKIAGQAHHPAGQGRRGRAGSSPSTTRPTCSSWPAARDASTSSRSSASTAERDRALDTVTRLAIGAGFDALRDAGIPLVQHYRLTSLGTQLPDRDGACPTSMRDDTGVIFASAFPGFDSFADELERHYTDQGRRHELEGLRSLRARVTDAEPVAAELDHRIARAGGAARRGGLRVRPPLPVPRAVDGALAVRRDHRRPRAEHPGELRLREHHAGHRPGRGLDPRRPLPPGRHRRR